MHTHTILIGAVALITLGCSSCGSSSSRLYSWYDYEHTSHAYAKSHSPEAQSKLIESYKKIIAHQREGRRVVPPGIYAEYGYLLLKNGDKEQGIKMLEQERKLYPESAEFISRIIKQYK